MESKKYEKAQRKVEDLRSFYMHSIVYVFVNTMLIVINVKTYKQSESWWFIYPLIGWGVGLAIQGLSVSSKGPFGQKWKEKKIHEYIEKGNENFND